MPFGCSPLVMSCRLVVKIGPAVVAHDVELPGTPEAGPAPRAANALDPKIGPTPSRPGSRRWGCDSSDVVGRVGQIQELDDFASESPIGKTLHARIVAIAG